LSAVGGGETEVGNTSQRSLHGKKIKKQNKKMQEEGVGGVGYVAGPVEG